MNYYQHNIGDYRRDTSHLSLLEHGIYRQLLDWYYLDEAPIPKETQVVFRRLSAKTQDEQNAIEIILKEFFFEGNDGWSHRRCDAEIANYQSKSVVNRENGKLGGRPRKTQSVISGIANETPNESENNPNHKPITNKPITNNHIKTFDDFWKIYPKKVSKGQAEKSWAKLKPDSELFDLIVSAIAVQRKTDKWQKNGGEFIPHPATWLNAKGWLDEVSVQAPLNKIGKDCE